MAAALACVWRSVPDTEATRDRSACPDRAAQLDLCGDNQRASDTEAKGMCLVVAPTEFGAVLHKPKDLMRVKKTRLRRGQTGSATHE